MVPKISLSVTLRISNIPDNKLDLIKHSAKEFKNEIKTILSDTEFNDDVYYDFNITDAEWIDEELYDGEYRSHRRNGRRIG